MHFWGNRYKSIKTGKKLSWSKILQKNQCASQNSGHMPHKILFYFSAYIWENKLKLVQFYLITIIKVKKIQEMVLKSDYRIFWSRRLKIVLLVQKDAFTTVTESGNFSNFILYLSKTSVSMVYSCQKYGWSVLGPIEV